MEARFPCLEGAEPVVIFSTHHSSKHSLWLLEDFRDPSQNLQTQDSNIASPTWRENMRKFVRFSLLFFLSNYRSDTLLPVVRKWKSLEQARLPPSEGKMPLPGMLCRACFAPAMTNKHRLLPAESGVFILLLDSNRTLSRSRCSCVWDDHFQGWPQLKTAPGLQGVLL
jgi:hypothetical protein